MCLSTVYKADGSERVKLAEYVSSVRSEGDRITLTDIMGAETVVFGAMKSVDLVKNEIVVEGAGQ